MQEAFESTISAEICSLWAGWELGLLELFCVLFQDLDLDHQSLSSMDKNASERGQSQFSNPTDESWKGGPYTSKGNVQVY